MSIEATSSKKHCVAATGSIILDKLRNSDGSWLHSSPDGINVKKKKDHENARPSKVKLDSHHHRVPFDLFNPERLRNEFEECLWDHQRMLRRKMSPDEVVFSSRSAQINHEQRLENFRRRKMNQEGTKKGSRRLRPSLWKHKGI